MKFLFDKQKKDTYSLTPYFNSVFSLDGNDETI